MNKLFSIFLVSLSVIYSWMPAMGKEDAFTPDFAFPVTVINHADSIFNLKPASAKTPQLLEALVQYSLAKSMISRDNFSSIIQKMDSVAAKEKDLAARGIIYSLEAEIFSRYYYSRRGYISEEITDTIPKDYSEWTDQQFKNKIISLVKLSLENRDVTLKSAVSDFKPVVIYDKYGELLCPTIYDLLLKRGINLIENRIDDNDQTINKLIDQQLKYYTNNIPVSIYYEILKDNDNLSLDYNKTINLYNKYRDSEYSGLIISKYQSGLVEKHEYNALYPILLDFKKKFPSYPFMNTIQELINKLCEKNISVKGNGYFSSTENIKLSVENTNVPSFKLSIYRLPDSYNGEYKNFPKIENMSLIATNSIETNKTIPFNEDSINVNFAPLPFGRYTVISSYIADGKEQIDYSKDIFNVTDIKLFGVNGLNNKNIVAATVGSTGVPLKNIELELKDNKKEIIHLKTNSKGILEIKDENYTIYAQKDNDKYAQPLYIYSNNNDINRKIDNIEINTNLAVYHEGDTVKFVAIAYYSDRHQDDVVSNLECEARLLNVNNQVVDSINLTSDKYGRLSSSFVIPKGGLLGNYIIRIKSLKDNTQAVSVIEVAAYKLPTFCIEMDETLPKYPKNTPITISGKIMSFSGIPLDNNAVEIILKKSDWMPWWRNNYSSTIVETTIVKTNEQGIFSYIIPSDKLESTNKEFFQYTVEVLATSLSGETQSTNQYFIVGETSQLEFTNKKIFEVSAPIILPVELHSTSKDVPECNFSIINLKKDTVLSGTFIPQKSLIDLSNVPSGKYELTVGLKNDTSSIVSSNIIIYRETDKDSPVDTPLWIPQLRIKADSNNKASFLIGNETDNNHIYYITSIKDKVLSSGWIKLDNGLKRFNVDIPKEIKENINVSFIMVKDFKTYYAHALIDNNIAPDSLKITIESFRDKLTAGNTEKWKFHFINSSNNGTPAAMILNVSNKAIEEIAPNRFAFTPNKYYFKNISFVTNYNSKFYSESNYTGKNTYSSTSIEYPNLNLYGHNFFSYSNQEIAYSAFGIVNKSLVGGIRIKSHRNETIDDIVSDQEEVAKKESLENVVVRKGNVNTALWLPMLETDEKGNLDVSFNVPNENTTWLVKAIGYTKNLLVDDISREIIANKPIMVEPNLPRFLRQGDDAVINALVINSSDTIQHCAAVVELFDYTTNRVIYSKNFNLEIPVNKQKLCSISWHVPNSISFIGYRIKAANQSFSDGEQSLLPILPSISPVIESLPFFINPGSEEMKVQVPKIPSSAKVTLEYCNNPTWSCLTALPSIFNTSAITATQATHTLYAILTAQGIAKMSPKIKEAIEYWTKNPKDSVLVSALEKNQSLKITELSNSPWLTAAQQETLQMQGISKLYDPIYCDNIKNKMIDILASLQQRDGGWSWYKNSPSSYYTSTQILQLLGELKNLNYLSDELKLQEMIEKGVKYLDNEVIRQYNEQKNKSDMSRFCHYAYVRSFFLDIPQSVTLKNFTDKALDIYTSSWKRMSIPDKAYSAIVLQRYDRNQPAKEIIRSIGQFAISTPSQGTYWDNLKGGYSYYYNKVTITSLILQAIHSVDANSKLIDPVRQWILLQKQTQNWGNSSLATDAIYTLLSTGSNWIEQDGKADITINGNPLSFNETSKYLGYEKRVIPVSEISGSLLSVSRKGASPAWGALYWQYASPMAEIKAASTPDISITKTLYTVDGNKLINNSELKVGDRVRVRLVVKNKQNLEYVNIVDERCATAEPTKQLSGYNFEDNIGYYLEIQNSDTNMYIYSLPKGTHIFHYDVTITSAGEYNLGIATIQCQYAPQFTAHSAGAIVTVK